MNAIRVLHYAPGFDHGGIESRLIDWYRSIDRERIHFDLLIQTSLENPLLREFEALGGNVHSLGKVELLRPMRYWRNIVDYFSAQEPYDVVHCHSVETSFPILRAASKCGTPQLVLHSRTTRHSGSLIPVRRLSKWLSVHSAKEFFACSEEAGLFMLEDVRWNRPEVTVVRNGFDTQDFRFDPDLRREVRDELGLKDSFVVLNVGRLTSQKNPSYALDVLSEIRRRRAEAVMVFVGEGPLRSAIEQRAAELGISNSTRMLGYQRNISRIMQAADVFMQPSNYEGFGTVAVEAQAAGLPTVVSTGFPESVAVTDLISRLDLTAGPVIWADVLLRLTEAHERRDTLKEIQTAGFDASRTARFLERFYIQSCNRELGKPS